MTDDENLRALEARVDRLERMLPERAGPDPDAASGRASGVAPAGTDDRFWALNGLRERTDSPGGVLFVGAVELPGDQTAQWQQGQSLDGLLEEEWSDASESLAALGHPVRLLLLRQVLAGARTVAELAAVDGLGTTGQVYHHLRQLASAGWVRSAGRGRYEVPAQRVVPLLVVVAATRR